MYNARQRTDICEQCLHFLFDGNVTVSNTKRVTLCVGKFTSAPIQKKLLHTLILNRINDVSPMLLDIFTNGIGNRIMIEQAHHQIRFSLFYHGSTSGVWPPHHGRQSGSIAI